MNDHRFSAVVWDLDGTLVDSAADIAQAVNRVLTESHLQTLPLEDIRSMIGNGAGKLLERAFTAADGINEYVAEAAYQRFLACYGERCCDLTTFYPGVYDAVRAFHLAGIPQAICTNKPHAITLSMLEQLGINSYFGAVIGGDSTAQRKPHALPLLTCIEALKVASEAVLLVGDSAADVGAAKACEVPVAVVSWGYSHTSAEQLGGDFLIDEPQQLLQLVMPEVH